jgi:PPE-repeat protein
MAAPPEVHSALLSSGPGAGPLLSAAGAWRSLSVAYAEVADELGALVAAVQSGVWEGPSAESYVTAHAPYVEWLLRASAENAATAAEHETAAAAYTAALAAMPTLAELAANHTTHAGLVATNFFGINTIPIALNEADYARMWIQAATTMGSYHAVAGAAVATSPRTGPAPQIQKSDASKAAEWGSSDFEPTWLDRIIMDAYQAITGQPPTPPSAPPDGLWAQLIDIPNQIYQGIFVHFAQSLQNVHTLPELFAAFQYFVVNFIYWRLIEISHLLTSFGPQLLQVALGSTIVGLGAVTSLGAAGGVAGATGLAGLSGLAGLAGIPAPTDVMAPVGSSPVTGMAPAGVTPAASAAGTPAPAPAGPPAAASPAPAPPSPGAPPPTAPPAPSIGGESFAYLVGGIPAATKSSTRARPKTPAPAADLAASAAGTAAAAAQHKTRRRRRRVTQRGHGDEYADMDIAVAPDWADPPPGEPPTASAVADRGAGALGFTGTASTGAVASASGMTRLADDELSGSPATPMMPASWEAGPDHNGSDPR